jgi:hypothetical protein
MGQHHEQDHQSMKALLLLLALLPALALGAEGDIPIVQPDGTVQTKTVSGDISIAADGSVTVDAIQAGDDADTLGSGTAADGYVLTADGSAGAAWEAAPAGGSSVWWTDVNYSTDANPAPDCDEQYLIDAGAWAATRTLTLPTDCTYGQRVAVMLEDVAAGSGLTITGDINGTTGEWSKLLLRGERVTLLNVGGTQWMVEQDGRTAAYSIIKGDLSDEQDNSESAGTFIEIGVMDDLSGVTNAFVGYGGDYSVDDDASTLTARRASKVVVCGGYGGPPASAAGWGQIVIENATTSAAIAPKWSFNASDQLGGAWCMLDTASVGDVYQMRLRSSTGDLGANQQPANFLSIQEVR